MISSSADGARPHQSRIIPSVIAAALTLLLYLFTPDRAAAAGYDVLGTGDSILSRALGIAAPGGAIITADTWIDVEYGRSPWDPTDGMQQRSSTASVWNLMMARSEPGDVLIVQDNTLQSLDAEWRALVDKIVREAEAGDRCVVFVKPIYHWDWSLNLYYAVETRSRYLHQEAQKVSCRYVIDWADAVRGDPWMLCDPRYPVNSVSNPCDGQHPSQRGQIWLKRTLDAAIDRLS